MDFYVSLIGLALIITAVVNGIYGHIYKVPNMPSLPQTRSKILKDIEDQRGDCAGLTICDLGSGWGGLCRALAWRFPKATVFGFEISPIPYAVSMIFQWLDLLHHYHIRRVNLFSADLSKADIAICYLTDDHMAQLKDKVLMQMKPGSLLYSQGFALPDIRPSSVIPAPFSLEGKIYRYDF